VLASPVLLVSASTRTAGPQPTSNSTIATRRNAISLARRSFRRCYSAATGTISPCATSRCTSVSGSKRNT
jgi:hypothetical protein